MSKRLLALLICHALTFAVTAQTRNHNPPRANVTVRVTPGHPANRFSPARALGAGIDGSSKDTLDLQLRPQNVEAMLSAGLKSLTYRLRTELANEVWHWNSQGSWSDPERREGYWTSEAKLGAPISLSYGYRLPRRGNTIDQANDEGYSVIDDGDAQTFWKSNPYLDQHFTREPNSLHPQWIVIEFPKPERINALRIIWGKPFAETFRVQYGNFDDVSDIALNPPEMWHDFPTHVFVGGGDDQPNSKGSLLRVAKDRIAARWIRILMTESSDNSDVPANDVRDRSGFAIRELSAGYQDASGNFHDRMQHAADRKRQTIIHVSSTDPWHREADRDENIEQLGLDRVYSSGLTNNLPTLLPTGLLFDTPENAANEINYLRARGYKFERVELGEEPDGQYATPEDYGALYLQWANAIHRVAPEVKLGGPSFQEILKDEDVPANRGNSAWLGRFLEYLARRGRLADYSFFSFEWYPFDEVCEATAPQLARAPRLMENALSAMQRNGLPSRIPWVISEYGYSAFASRAEIDIDGALLNADIVGKFLTLKGDEVYLFGYPPGYFNRDFPCTVGNNMLFSLGDDGNLAHRFASYFGARLLTQAWLHPGDGMHEIYPATSDVLNARGEELVTAYAVKRPDGLWALLLINKDPKQNFDALPLFKVSGTRTREEFQGSVDVYQYSREQYVLGGPEREPYPLKADDPAHRVENVNENGALKVNLPPYSLTVIRGVIGSPKQNQKPRFVAPWRRPRFRRTSRDLKSAAAHTRAPVHAPA